MMKLVFGLAVVVLVAALAVLTWKIRKTSNDETPEGKKVARYSAICLALALILGVACVAPSLMKSGIDAQYEVAYLSKSSMTLIDKNNGDAVKVDLYEVPYDDNIKEGDFVTVVVNFWGTPQYIGKPQGTVAVTQPDTTPAETNP